MIFPDKVAIITGSGRGIGRAIALRLAKEDAKVVAVDKVQDTVNHTVESIKEAGGQAISIQTDVTQGDEVRSMVQTTMEQFQKIDILVNNVGWSTYEPFLQTDEATWGMLLDINLKSTLLCCRAVLEEMIKKEYGKIVNISSDAGRAGMSTQASYSAAKSGVIGLTKTLAREMARYKINVNCICPGVIDTPLAHETGAHNPKIQERLTRTIPWRRLGRPEEVAAAVCFLVSDDAEYITGQTLSVDGGLTMF